MPIKLHPRYLKNGNLEATYKSGKLIKSRNKHGAVFCLIWYHLMIFKKCSLSTDLSKCLKFVKINFLVMIFFILFFVIPESVIFYFVELRRASSIDEVFLFKMTLDVPLINPIISNYLKVTSAIKLFFVVKFPWCAITDFFYLKKK